MVRVAGSVVVPTVTSPKSKLVGVVASIARHGATIPKKSRAIEIDRILITIFKFIFQSPSFSKMSILCL